MKKILSPAGEMLAVIRGVEVLPWGSMPHRALGLTLELLTPPREGCWLTRWVFFDAWAPQLARERFSRLGGRISQVAEIDAEAASLVGGRLRVRLVRDAQGREKPLILGFAGREVCEQLTLGR